MTRQTIQVISRFESGLGIGTYTRALVDALQAAGQPVRLVSARLPDNRLREPLAVPYLMRALRRAPAADVYHADYVDSAVAALACGRTPLVVTVHDDIPRLYAGDRHPLWVRYYEFIFARLARSDATFITVSECSKRDLAARGIDPARIFVVPNGVDHAAFQPAPEPGSRPGPLRIGYLATLSRRKRVDRLLDAFAAVQAEVPDVALDIGGTGPLGDELAAQARSLGLRNVTFRGFVAQDALADFYRSLDVFVLPSDYEGFGLTVVEAMACGVPVVTTRVSSLPEVVGDSGLLCDPDPADFARKILSLVRNPCLRQRYAALGLARAARFDWSRVAEETLAVYAAKAAGTPAPQAGPC